MKNVLDNREVWKTKKPFLSDKNIIFSQISIEKNKKIISDDFDFFGEFNTFLENAIRLASVKLDKYYLNDKKKKE